MKHQLSATAVQILRIVKELQTIGRQTVYPARENMRRLAGQVPTATERQLFSMVFGNRTCPPPIGPEFVTQYSLIRFDPAPDYLIVAELMPFPVPDDFMSVAQRLDANLNELRLRELIRPVEHDHVEYAEYIRPDAVSIEVQNPGVRVAGKILARLTFRRPDAGWLSGGTYWGRAACWAYSITPTGLTVLDAMSADTQAGGRTGAMTVEPVIVEGEWLTPPMSLADLANRLGCIGTSKARSVLEPYGLRKPGKNRQLWTVRLDTMPANMAQKLRGK